MRLYGIDKNSHLEIGSVSKSFTGILLAWLVNTRRDVHLTDPVARHIPELEGSFAGSRTLEQLATQKSGLAATFPFIEKSPLDPWAELDPRDVLTTLKELPQLGPGPFSYEYANVNFVLLGLALTRLTKQSFSDLLKQVITDPLAMNETFVSRPGLEIPRLLQGHSVTSGPVGHWHFSDLSAPTGGIVSTPSDMAKYLAANANPPEDDLGRAIELSHKFQLGWDSADNSPEDQTIWKNGSTNGFSSLITFNPETKIGSMVLSNQAGTYSASLASYPIYLPAIFGPTFPDLRGGPVTKTQLEKFAGSYSYLNETITITASDRYLRVTTPAKDLDLRLQVSMTNPNLFLATDGVRGIGSFLFTFEEEGVRLENFNHTFSMTLVKIK